ncbi:hypothetical protein QR98_0036820 [Sarcoptes scabiei]|uniref:Uncharacterized protein n=1 Tax=Sarcoptes scabiei TaxID=52283 RepID=A0A132A2G2_SARSC|nr:hypothetical protein QR98_0036820 [Sarcoptes scabiei]
MIASRPSKPAAQINPEEMNANVDGATFKVINKQVEDSRMFVLEFKTIPNLTILEANNNLIFI